MTWEMLVLAGIMAILVAWLILNSYYVMRDKNESDKKDKGEGKNGHN